MTNNEDFGKFNLLISLISWLITWADDVNSIAKLILTLIGIVSSILAARYYYYKANEIKKRTEKNK